MKKQANRYYGNYEKPPTDEEWKNMAQETMKNFGKETLLRLDDLPQDAAEAFRNFGNRKLKK